MTLLKHRTRQVRPFRNHPFSSFFGNDFPEIWGNEELETVPSLNITENKDHFSVELAAPGLKKEDFNIDVNGNTITISCEKESENNNEEEGRSWREYNYSSFSRMFTLPENADVNAGEITAKYNDGILKMEIPKRKNAGEEKKRKISVK